MKELSVTYQEYLLIEGIIKSNDPLDSYREGYLSFLDDLSKNYDSSLQEEGKSSSVVDLDNLTIKIKVPVKIVNFLTEELKDNSVFTLNSKLVSK